VNGADTGLRLDARITVVGEEDVGRLLRSEPDLLPLVNEAAEQLSHYFPDAGLHLRYAVDPEDGEYEELVLGASMGPDVRATMDALRRFDQAWWLANGRRASGLLLVTFE
jgi:hypothetical protein